METTTVQKVKSVDELYADRTLYTSRDMFSPPSERLPHVIRFELTEGCDWGKCTYCGGFDGVQFREKSIGGFKEHVDKVWERIGNRTNLARNLKRVFIGGGNALGVETDKLLEAVHYVKKSFARNTEYEPTRVAIYGRTTSIAQKGRRDLGHLRRGRDYTDGGIGLVYWGLESGCPEVLKWVNKGCNEEQVETAVWSLRDSNMPVSVMVMPGLGGKRFEESHAEKTARTIRTISPKYLTFMGINANPSSKYNLKMKEEMDAGINRPLTSKEIALQMAMIVELMHVSPKVGCFPTDIDQVGNNPVPFGSLNIGEDITRGGLVKIIRNIATTLNN